MLLRNQSLGSAMNKETVTQKGHDSLKLKSGLSMVLGQNLGIYKAVTPPYLRYETTRGMTIYTDSQAVLRTLKSKTIRLKMATIVMNFFIDPR